MSMWDEEDGIVGEKLVIGTITVMGFVSKTTSRMELEGKNGVGESVSETKLKE